MESIDGQLSGAIPSTDNGQRQDSTSLVNASDIDLAAMGKFSMGGSGQGQYKAPQQSLDQAVKNGIFYGICLVVIVAAMLIINHIKRRK